MGTEVQLAVAHPCGLVAALRAFVAWLRGGTSLGRPIAAALVIAAALHPAPARGAAPAGSEVGALRAVLASASPPAPASIGEVEYVHAEGLFLRVEPGAGLRGGDVVQILGRRDQRARAEIRDALDDRARAVLDAPAPWVRPGDAVVRAPGAGGASPVPEGAETSEGVDGEGAETSEGVDGEGASAGTPPRAGPAAVRELPSPPPWEEPTYAKVDRQRSLPGPSLRPMRTRAALHGTGWLWLERSGSDFQRDSLELLVHGPLDAEGDFVLDADLRLTGQLLVPADARDRSEQSVYFDIYRANLTYLGWDPLSLAVGRRALPSLRWGQVDGVSVGWRLEDGPSLEVALGVRSDLDSLWPEHFRPVASFGLGGRAAWEPAQLSYRLGASWLGVDQMTTEGLEAGAGAVLDLFGWLSLDAEVGLLALFPTDAEASASLDRASVGASARFADRALVRVAGRRLDTTALLSDLSILPEASLLGGSPWWDASADTHVYLGEWGAAAVDGALSGGVIVEETSGDPRGWVAPAVTWRLSRLYDLRVRVGYRADVGDLGGHVGELSIGIEPVEDLRIDLRQQGGVWALATSKSVHPTATTWLRVAWQPLAWLAVDLRGRALYGDTGTGFVIDARVAAIDFW